MQGPIGYVPVPDTRPTDSLDHRNGEYEPVLSSRVDNVDRGRRQRSSLVGPRRRPVSGIVDRGQRPLSYVDPRPATDSVAQYSCGYLNDTPERVKST